MDEQTHTTTDHSEIKKWVKERDGRPARVKGTENDGGVLRIVFGDVPDDLEGINWETFFEAFEENNLAFVYQEEGEDEQTSRFYTMVERDTD